MYIYIHIYIYFAFNISIFICHIFIFIYVTCICILCHIYIYIYRFVSWCCSLAKSISLFWRGTAPLDRQMSYQVLLKKTAMLSQSLQRNLPAPYPPDSNVVTSLCLEGPPRKKQPFRFGCRQAWVIDQGGTGGSWQHVGGWLFFEEPGMLCICMYLHIQQKSKSHWSH